MLPFPRTSVAGNNGCRLPGLGVVRDQIWSREGGRP